MFVILMIVRFYFLRHCHDLLCFHKMDKIYNLFAYACHSLSKTSLWYASQICKYMKMAVSLIYACQKHKREGLGQNNAANTSSCCHMLSRNLYRCFDIYFGAFEHKNIFVCFVMYLCFSKYTCVFCNVFVFF